MKIDRKTKVTDLLKDSKKAVEVFKKYNLDCPGCRGASQDSIEKVAINNGLDPDEFLREINNTVAE